MADVPLAEGVHTPLHRRDVRVRGEREHGAGADRARLGRGQAHPVHGRPAGNRATRPRLVCSSSYISPSWHHIIVLVLLIVYTRPQVYNSSTAVLIYLCE